MSWKKVENLEKDDIHKEYWLCEKYVDDGDGEIFYTHYVGYLARIDGDGMWFCVEGDDDLIRNITHYRETVDPK